MKRKYTDRVSTSGLLLVGGAAVMVLTNWRLVLTLLCGTTAMLIAYQYRRSGTPSQRLLWAMGVGSGSVFTCYLLLMLLQSHPNGWVGVAAAVQFLAVLAILLLLLYQTWGERSKERTVDQLILQLASEDHLTRLIALQELQKKAAQHTLSFQQEQRLQEYCQILLAQNASPALTNAALATIESLQFAPLQPKLQYQTLVTPPEVA